jgi:hypothetical protein
VVAVRGRGKDRQPDAYRRDVKLFLKFRNQRLTTQNANQ